MTKIIFTWLLIALALSACSVDWNNEKDKRIEELEKKSFEIEAKKDDSLFKKKQECISLASDMKSEFNDIYADTKNLSPDSHSAYEALFGEIFYSNSAKSCFYKVSLLYSWKGDYVESHVFLHDFLSKKIYVTDSGICKYSAPLWIIAQKCVAKQIEVIPGENTIRN